LDRFLQSSA